uniref:Uncharacterized protein n=1 Tax=Trypanosoma congolense (strain IL3000) TaxID=1068625 RepID=G0UYF9_TRYCI|nr:conserved hypothetical protein [Trypanosoma congolense IL3000]
MIPPKISSHQELTLRRVNVQQQSFSSQRSGSALGPAGNATTSYGSNSGVPRAAPPRGDTPVQWGSSGAVSAPTAASAPNQKTRLQVLDAPLTGGGTNSTAPASIARPGVRRRDEWAKALSEVQPFSAEQRPVSNSSLVERNVVVHYIADQYDRQWLAQAPGSATEGENNRGNILLSGETTPQGPKTVRPNISLMMFEKLITAFELHSYTNATTAVDQLSVSALDNVVSTGADAATIEEVRKYWISKRRALGGGIPCIPALRTNVREDNQQILCRAGILQYCPLPFNSRDCPVPLVRRAAPCQREKIKVEVEHNEDAEDEPEIAGSKRKRRSSIRAMKPEHDDGEVTAEAGSVERHVLLTAAHKVALAVLEREELKLVHMHIALHELALLRQLAVLGSDLGTPTGSPSLDVSRGAGFTPVGTSWATEDALRQEWVDENEVVGEVYDGATGRKSTAALESVMAIERRHC